MIAEDERDRRVTGEWKAWPDGKHSRWEWRERTSGKACVYDVCRDLIPGMTWEEARAIYSSMGSVMAWSPYCRPPDRDASGADHPAGKRSGE